jgi:hypothetical protein
MRPIAKSYGHDSPGLIDDLVPCVAAVVDDLGVRLEDPVREPILADELPKVSKRLRIDAIDIALCRR